MIVIAAYDDHRREDVAMFLSGYGPRVQLSVFECDVRSADELRQPRVAIRDGIDTLEDQVRLYPTTTQTFAERYALEFQHRLERHGHRLADRLVVYDEVDADVRKLGRADYGFESHRDPDR